jgi:hypothetical protein
MLPILSPAQIVNVEASRLQEDTLGWQGSGTLNFSYTQSVNKLFVIQAGTGAQYRKGKHIWLSINNLNLVFSSDEDFSFSGFQHFRYNYLVNKWYTAEAFTQGQFDRIQKIDFRYLLGGGNRFTLYKKPKGRIYLGLAAMYEYERESNTGIRHNDVRLSNYLSATYQPSGNFTATTIVYYQPRINYLRDYRVTTSTNLFFKFNQYLSFTTSFGLNYDSEPVQDPDVVKLSLAVTQGVVVRW